jgi:hypothetical protein
MAGVLAVNRFARWYRWHGDYRIATENQVRDDERRTSVTCPAIHSAVGFAVMQKVTNRLRVQNLELLPNQQSAAPMSFFS